MSKGVNRVMLLGHVGKDPEIRSSQGGTLFANFSLATADRQKDSSGQWVDHTEWHNILAVGKTAEIIREYVRKGSHLFVQGKIQTKSWDDRETGAKRYKTEIFVSEVSLLGGKSDGARSSRGNDYDQTDMGYADEDVPF